MAGSETFQPNLLHKHVLSSKLNTVHAPYIPRYMHCNSALVHTHTFKYKPDYNDLLLSVFKKKDFGRILTLISIKNNDQIL